MGALEGWGCGFLKGRGLGGCVCERPEPQEGMAVGRGGCGRARLWDGVAVGKCDCERTGCGMCPQEGCCNGVWPRVGVAVKGQLLKPDFQAHNLFTFVVRPSIPLHLSSPLSPPESIGTVTL